MVLSSDVLTNYRSGCSSYKVALYGNGTVPPQLHKPVTQPLINAKMVRNNRTYDVFLNFHRVKIHVNDRDTYIHKGDTVMIVFPKMKENICFE